MATPAQMAAFGQSLNAQESNVARQESLAQSMDPALVSAGKQLNDLLQGKSAPVMQNLNNQRQLQRQQMVDQLNSSGMGSTSAAGMQQLNQFDAQTANMQTQTQQSYMDQISKLPLQGAQEGNALTGANQSLASMQTESPEAQKARLQLGFTQLENAPRSAMVNAAGLSASGGLLGSILDSQQNTGLQKSLVTAAPMIAGAFKGSGSSGPGTGGTDQYSAMTGTQDMGPNVMNAYRGGVVPGRKYMAKGGIIPGVPPAGRKNTLANDIIPVNSSPGEMFVPLSHMGSKAKAKQFVDDNWQRPAEAKKGTAKTHFDQGGVQGEAQPSAWSSFLSTVSSTLDNMKDPTQRPEGLSTYKNRDPNMNSTMGKSLSKTFGG